MRNRETKVNKFRFNGSEFPMLRVAFKVHREKEIIKEIV